MASDAIWIRDLEVLCTIGVNPDERERVQPMVVQVELAMDLAVAGRSGAIADTCNYDRVADEIAALLRFWRYRLLESAAEELSAMLLAAHPGLVGVGLRLDKPEALRGRAAAASVRVRRRPLDFPHHLGSSRFGPVDVVLETAEAALYLLHISPGATIAAHQAHQAHQAQRVGGLEWQVRGELLRGGTRFAGLAPTVWSSGEAADYVNTGAAVATVFCCDLVNVPEDRSERP